MLELIDYKFLTFIIEVINWVSWTLEFKQIFMFCQGDSDLKKWWKKRWAVKMGRWHEKIRFRLRGYASPHFFQCFHHPLRPSTASRPPGRTLWTWFSHVSDPFSTLIICFAIVSNQNSLGQDMNICINSRRSWHSINYFNNDRQKSEVNSF